MFKSSVFGSSGTLVFFLHGWPDSSSIYSSVIEELSKTHRCVAVESPLNGWTTESVIGPTFLV